MIWQVSPLHELRKLAHLLKDRNRIDGEIAAIIGRPASTGHIGEFVASAIFGIRLEGSATHKGTDGRFVSGPLAGKSVNIKMYGRQEGLLDIQEAALPDYFLVLTGPPGPATTSRGRVRPLVIERVYLFDGLELADDIRRRGVKFGVAASVPKRQWEQAEIYPAARNRDLILTDEQMELLRHFSEI